MNLLQSFTLVFGLIIALFGLSLILFKNFWRGFGRGVGEISAATNNAAAKITGVSRLIKYKGVDEKHMPSNKGLKIVGVVFIVFGILIILIPYIG